MARQSRRKGERPIPKLVYDHEAMFVAETRRLALGAAILDAYRKSMGFVFNANQSSEASASLRAAARASSEACDPWGRHDWARAMENAGRQAMLAYVGQWWAATPCMQAPASIHQGEEYYSRETVAAIVERRGEPTPDQCGDIANQNPPIATRAAAAK